MNTALGILHQREYAPESVVEAAQRYERLGFDDVWLVEDLGFAGGLTAAALALQGTSSVNVGIGILAAVARNPVFTAMEVATLARLHPRRFMPGIGHGMQDWMESVGARVGSPLTMLSETLEVVVRLLAGNHISVSGRYIKVKDASLRFPPTEPPLILAGVRGPLSLALAGHSCDGALLAEPVTPEYIGWARRQLDEPARAAGRGRPQLAVYSWLSVDDDPVAAQDQLRIPLASNISHPSVRAHLRGLDFADELVEVATNNVSTAQFAAALRPQWISRLAIAGTPGQCAETITKLAEAGADRIILLPVPGDARRQAERFAQTVLPLLRSA
jgi:alkanesulfonate monooxygenase SsuD/methylene tetrahydromethanopterin reductase-like flavin-dependent oxidoreductase (luciferase family)